MVMQIFRSFLVVLISFTLTQCNNSGSHRNNALNPDGDLNSGAGQVNGVDADIAGESTGGSTGESTGSTGGDTGQVDQVKCDENNSCPHNAVCIDGTCKGLGAEITEELVDVEISIDVQIDPYFPLALAYGYLFEDGVPFINAETEEAKSIQDKLTKALTGKFYVVFYEEDSKEKPIYLTQAFLESDNMGVEDKGEGLYSIKSGKADALTGLPTYFPFTLKFNKVPNKPVYAALVFDTENDAVKCSLQDMKACPGKLDAVPMQMKDQINVGGNINQDLLFNRDPHGLVYFEDHTKGLNHFKIGANESGSDGTPFRFGTFVGLKNCNNKLDCNTLRLGESDIADGEDEEKDDEEVTTGNEGLITDNSNNVIDPYSSVPNSERVTRPGRYIGGSIPTSERYIAPSYSCDMVRCQPGTACSTATGKCESLTRKNLCENVRCQLGTACSTATGKCETISSTKIDPTLTRPIGTTSAQDLSTVDIQLNKPIDSTAIKPLVTPLPLRPLSTSTSTTTDTSSGSDTPTRVTPTLNEEIMKKDIQTQNELSAIGAMDQLNKTQLEVNKVNPLLVNPIQDINKTMPVNPQGTQY